MNNKGDMTLKDLDFQQLSIAFTEHDKVWAYCMYHKDTLRPNLSISLLDRYYGRWKCWACGRDGRLSKEQMEELNLRNSIPHKNSGANLLTRWKQFTESCQDNLQKFPLLKLGLAKQLNVSTESLDDWMVGFDGDAFTIPMFREDLGEYHFQGGFCGIQKRFSDSTKRCVSGSHLGLMYSYDNISDCPIFICEGFSDGVSIYDLGLNSMARPHCRHAEGIVEFFNEEMGVDTVIIIPDNDTVGLAGAEELYDILRWDFDCSIFSFEGAKDIRKLIQLKGKHCVQQELRKYM